jgi:hypothetical protein
MSDIRWVSADICYTIGKPQCSNEVVHSVLIVAKETVCSHSTILEWETARSESGRPERSGLGTHGPFLRSVDGPKVEAVAESEYSSWWDGWFVHGNAAQ